MSKQEWIQHVVVGLMAVAALVYLIVRARRRKPENSCPYCQIKR